MKIELVTIETVIPYARNPRKHAENVGAIAASIKEFGWMYPILVSSEMVIIAGHGRYLAAQRLGLKQVPIHIATDLTTAQIKAYRIADNKLAEKSAWDEDLLTIELGDLLADGYDLELTGLDADEIEKALHGDGGEGNGDSPKQSGALLERFGVPPFTVLDARQGYWQERKQAWLSLGIQSEIGRAEVQSSMASARQVQTGTQDAESWVTTSVFDPVLCELAYRWFSPVGGVVIDPFAGGSVRGIIAARLGRIYHGVDLRPEQIEENQRQAGQLCKDVVPSWYAGDSRSITAILQGQAADLVFSCPPYADLEVYSNNPKDLSTLDYPEFLKAYHQIIADTCTLLKPDRFACFVVGDVRDKKGYYYNFVSDTIAAFQDAGLRLYNEAILVTSIGSLPIRVGKLFTSSRKLGKTHQNVLVFCKGDPKKATAALGEVEFGDIEELEIDLEA